MSSDPALELQQTLVRLLPVLRPEVVLLRQALTHRSYRAQDPSASDNERLELLGDAVVDLAATEALLQGHPQAREGELSRLRAGMVRTETLAQLARQLGLDRMLRISRSEEADGGRGKESLLADAFEATVGAVFLSCGYAAAAELVVAMLQPYLSGRLPLLQDAKSLLQERAAMLQLPPPDYAAVASGPDHAPTFTATVSLPDGRSASGEGRSRKAAEQAAAEALLHRLAPGR